MPRKLRYFFRDFLNAPGQHANGFIAATVDAAPSPDELSEDYLPWVDGGDLAISDCNRQITLSFGVSDAEDRANSFAKLMLLEQVLAEFRTHLEAQAALAEALDEVRTARDRLRRRDGTEEDAAAVAALLQRARDIIEERPARKRPRKPAHR